MQSRADLLRSYREKYGEEVTNAQLSQIIYEEHWAIFPTVKSVYDQLVPAITCTPWKDQPVPKEMTTEERVEERREKAQIRMLISQVKQLTADHDELMEKYDNALMLQKPSSFEIPKIELNHKVNSQAIALTQWSDWHVEERIEKSTTLGLNEYNLDIASKRAAKLVENLLKVVNKERNAVKIDHILVTLGGDFINGFLHEHDVQMNFLSPLEATAFAKDLLVKSLRTLAHYGNFKKIIVKCVRGNHGRTTKKMISNLDYKMNYEALMYNFLKQELKDSLFEWHIPESSIGYIEVFNKVIRTIHGHEINYQGGIGDLGIPMNKFIMKQDKTRKADWTQIHHYHRFMMPTANSSLNGSMCGWNSYAHSLGFPYEPPQQAFQLLDSKRGFTVRMPIFCE